MDDELDALALRVRAGTDEFARDVAEMRGVLRDGLGREAASAGRTIEDSLRRAARSGRLEFEDLGRAAAKTLGEIAGAALKLDGVGLAGLSAGMTGLLGLPGRATGGPVAPGQAYLVGERGPEVFVPTSSGRIEAGAPARRSVQLTVNMRGEQRAASPFMAPTARQVAHEIRRVLERLDG